MKIPAEISLLN